MFLAMYWREGDAGHVDVFNVESQGFALDVHHQFSCRVNAGDFPNQSVISGDKPPFLAEATEEGEVFFLHVFEFL